jgi:hypothetical protein
MREAVGYLIGNPIRTSADLPLVTQNIDITGVMLERAYLMAI